MTGTEIVHRKVDAEFLQVFHRGDSVLDVVNRQAFSDFKLELARIRAGFFQHPLDLLKLRLVGQTNSIFEPVMNFAGRMPVFDAVAYVPTQCIGAIAAAASILVSTSPALKSA